MINRELLNPKSIVVVGASNDVEKPGGKALKNLLSGNFKGNIYAVNPKETEVQGIKCSHKVDDLPDTELAIMAIASKYILSSVEILIKQKKTKAIIVLSAGFSEIGPEGRILEEQLAKLCTDSGVSLIGPNCIGMLTPNYQGVFAGPLPKLQNDGIDFVSGSGATACFIMETAIPLGLTFANVYSVGNCAQIGVEDVLEYWDETFDPKTSSKVKMIYVEKIDKPERLLKHAKSLIQKGCKITAIKSGTTEAGSRAVSSHTGALAGSDLAVEALFRKAGIVRCYGREELVYVTGVFAHKTIEGENIAVITHAGGPGVMLTDELSKGKMKVPHIEGPDADELLTKLFFGSSVANPIDFIATGTAEQLSTILDYVDNKFKNIDASVVIFGTTGLFDVSPVYKVIDEKMKACNKPIIPVMPSPVVAADAVKYFQSLGRITFTDEVNLGKAISKIYNTPKPFADAKLPEIEVEKIREIIDNSENGYLSPENVHDLLDYAGIHRAKEFTVDTLEDAKLKAQSIGFPLVMKVVGPIHKSDVGGVVLNVKTLEQVEQEFSRIMKIKDAKAVLLQPMLSGTELFAGANKDNKYGHLILCGMGGIFIEVLKDVAAGLSPIGYEEAEYMIKQLRSYKLFEGVRGQAGISKEKFADVIVRLSALLQAAPEIAEMDLNPLLGKADSITAVDARIKIVK